MQKRRVIQRQDMVLQLDQHLDLVTAEDDALSHARGEAIHDFKIAFARAVLDNTAAQLIEDNSTYAHDLPFVGKDDVDPEPLAKPRCIEILDHGESCSQQADACKPVSGQRMAERIGDVEERNADARGDHAIQLVHRVAAQQNTAGTTLLQRGRLFPQAALDRPPITAPHGRLEPGKIDASHQDFSRMKAAETRRHHFVQEIIIDAGGLPAHPVDQADGLHDGFVSRRGRGTSSPPQLRHAMPSLSAHGRHHLHS